MHSLTYLTLDKDVRQARPAELDAFAAQISGGVLSAADADYDTARKVWALRWGRRPMPASSPPSIRGSGRARATTGSRTTSARSPTRRST
ncbi:hypothetical protein [Variovorax guangxiensis]|uniref:hypothetical protein n=1 Tax=Variovorax guangxiensis TaxID=1775474 RepID=UPI00285A411D|nr:hypothetical protein [Variovorax guangxiensis]MDR6858967.1 hypothetical protein [Variovorax guangxiensis]